MAQPRILTTYTRGQANPDNDLQEIKSLLPGKGPGVTTQIPAHAYDPDSWRYTWNEETFRIMIKLMVDRKRA